MTGFKSGASDDDPLGGDDDQEGSTPATSGLEADPEPIDEESATTSRGSGGLPWIYERNSITDGRKTTVQLHLQESTTDRQREAKRDVENVLGESVKKADLREAALLVGLEHTEEVADVLREWGYDFS